MTEAQIQLQNALTTTFLANLVFLSEYDNELYHRVDELSRMIENGVYKEKYALEFIMENGDFDIYDILNDKYLYEKKPKEYNKNLVKQIDFDENNSINTLEKGLYSNILKIDEKIIEEKRLKLQDPEDAELILKYDVSKYLEVMKKNNKTKTLKKIDKFIFFGTLLGRHINPIVDKIDASLYFVCEKNLEIFRLSLFVNDYSHLAKNDGVIFSIMENEEEIRNKIDKFLNINLFSNYLIKLSSTNLNVKYFIDTFLTTLVVDYKPTTFDYNRMLYTLMRNVSEKVNSEYFLQFDEIKNPEFFKNLPVLYIAAGPSFQENIEWIRKNQNKFIIVTVGAAYKTLINSKIRVDIVITLDASYKVLKEKQFSDSDVKLLKDSIVLYSSMTDKRLVKSFPKNKFVFDVVDSYHTQNKMLSASSVGEKGVELLLSFGVKKLYLLGLDLALNQETGDSHGKMSNSSKVKFDFEDQTIYDRSIFGLNTGLIKVKGNFLEEVFTTSLFKSSIECLNDVIKILKTDNVDIFNLSNHGALFDGVKPLSIDKIKLEDLSIDNELVKFFKLNSKKDLSKGNTQSIMSEIEYIRKDLFIEVAKLKDIEYYDYEKFKDNILNLVNKLAFRNERTTLLPFIFKNYFQIILNYLNYAFNDKKLKNTDKKLKQVNDLLINDITSMLENYTKFLENMIRVEL